MKRDGVTTAFEVMLDELSGVEGQLAEEGGEAFKQRRYLDAERLIQSVAKIEAFRGRIEALRDEWNSGNDTEPDSAEEVGASSDGRQPSARSARSVLRVRLPTGNVLQGRTAAETFVDTIQYLGVSAVERLGIQVNGVALISRTPHEKYNQQHVGAKYIMTHSSTAAKRDTLIEIGKRLSKKLEVEIV